MRTAFAPGQLPCDAGPSHRTLPMGLMALSAPRPLVDTRPAPSTSYPACSIPASRRAHLSTRTNALPLDQAGEALQHVLHTLPMAYERVALPCSQMNCGDMVYRSTLDPVLRMEQRGVSPQGVAIVAFVLAYLTATPGVLAGFWDTYVAAPLQRARNSKPYSKDDIIMGRRVATGGFGTVFKAQLVDPDTNNVRDVIVKKAKEFGEAEVWMNERLMRYAPQACAEFITAFVESDKPNSPLWLIWLYEGDFTLYDMMRQRDFPYNLEPLLFGAELPAPKGRARQLACIKAALRQLLLALNDCHSGGIVHRDIKPQNIIISQAGSPKRRLKLIDMGAAADLRVGINYAPNEFLLDPRYAPPQQYIMSTQTPKAPPAPIAAALSPVLWYLNKPDRFDMYSVGVVLLQMVFPSLRSDAALTTFNRKLGDVYGYDLREWRRAQSSSKRGAKDEIAAGLALLDADGGAGWELLCSLITYKPDDRLSSGAALRHRWFGAGGLDAVAGTISSVAGSLVSSMDDGGWLEEHLGSRDRDALTERQLREALGDSVDAKLPSSLRNASSTLAWWQSRQSELEARLAARQGKVKASIQRLKRSALKTVRETSKRGGKLLGLFTIGD